MQITVAGVLRPSFATLLVALATTAWWLPPLLVMVSVVAQTAQLSVLALALREIPDI